MVEKEIDNVKAVEKGKEIDKAKLEKEAATLGIKKSKVLMSGYKDKNPDKLEKEKAKHDKLVNKRLEGRVAKAKADAKKKPIDKRRALLKGRFRAVRSRRRPRTYSDKNIKAWVEEFNMIENNPQGWNRATANGTKPFTPSNKKKKTAREILDAMELDD